MAKDTCEASHKISIQFLKEHNYLIPPSKYGSINWSCRGEPTGSASIEVYPSEEYIKFIYNKTYYATGEREEFNYKVQLTTTPCFFGGKRFWFLCPLSINNAFCGKRVGVLYLAGKHFGCRICYDLAYESQQETHVGLFGLMRKVFRRDNEKYIKYKLWKGQPTKRYLRYLHKLDNGFSEADLDELNRRLGIIG
jgi:hypothetical protein